MIAPRVIPCLLLQNEGLVKGIKFKNHGYVGDPMNAVRIFNEKEVDELLLLDITATKEKRIIPLPFVEKVADECYMPFGLGGGIHSLDDIRRLLKSGAEKVVINTAAIQNPSLVSEASNHFGNQSIVVSIDVRKEWGGKYQIYTHCGTEPAKRDLPDFLVEMQDAGAGEILINSIDRDGTMEGYDLDLVKKVADVVSIPVIASCGAGKIKDIAELFAKTNAAAAAAGSLFVFYGKQRGVLINYPSRQEIDDLLETKNAFAFANHNVEH